MREATNRRLGLKIAALKPKFGRIASLEKWKFKIPYNSPTLHHASPNYQRKLFRKGPAAALSGNLSRDIFPSSAAVLRTFS
jgi:hypothetical protein